MRGKRWYLSALRVKTIKNISSFLTKLLQYLRIEIFSLEKGNSFMDFNVRPFLRQKGRSMKSI